MNIEEAIKYIKNDIEIDKDTASWFEKGNKTKEQIEESINAYETLLTAYEKEKAKVERIKDKLTHLKILAKIENKDIDRIKELEILLKEE